jgi:hypothetical protein
MFKIVCPNWLVMLVVEESNSALLPMGQKQLQSVKH